VVICKKKYLILNKGVFKMDKKEIKPVKSRKTTFILNKTILSEEEMDIFMLSEKEKV
jgi:hypothetical protein